MEPDPTDTPNRPTLSQTEFADRFDAIIPLILEEWPQLATEDLAATEGNLELAIDYIVARTDHTRTLVRHYLAELSRVQRWRETRQNSDSPNSDPSKLEDYILPTLDRTLKTLEGRTEKLLTRFETEMLPEVNRKAKENVGTSLLTALGIGFILGLLLGGSSRGR
ncbi:MAG: hypothetical protein ACP5D7_09445 [Limnospira sp.]